MSKICEACGEPFTGRVDKRFCSGKCRSGAWAKENLTVPQELKYQGMIKHGAARVGAKTPEYRIWCAMRERCANPNHNQYHRYGGRGIHVCERWTDFANFLADMGQRPSERHSIDRYPNKDGNYEPGNCRWATDDEQARNKGNSTMLTLNGETRHIVDWAEKLNLSINTIRTRLRKSRDPAEVLKPSKQQRISP